MCICWCRCLRVKDLRLQRHCLTRCGDQEVLSLPRSCCFNAMPRQLLRAARVVSCSKLVITRPSRGGGTAATRGLAIVFDRGVSLWNEVRDPSAPLARAGYCHRLLACKPECSNVGWVGLSSGVVTAPVRRL